MALIVDNSFIPNININSFIAKQLSQIDGSILLTGEYAQNHDEAYHDYGVKAPVNINMFEHLLHNDAAPKLETTWQKVGFPDAYFVNPYQGAVMATDNDRFDAMVYHWNDKFASVHRIEYRDYADQLMQTTYYNRHGRPSMIRSTDFDGKTALDQYVDDKGRVILQTTVENGFATAWRWYHSTLDFADYATEETLFTDWLKRELETLSGQRLFLVDPQIAQILTTQGFTDFTLISNTKTSGYDRYHNFFDQPIFNVIDNYDTVDQIAMLGDINDQKDMDVLRAAVNMLHTKLPNTDLLMMGNGEKKYAFFDLFDAETRKHVINYDQPYSDYAANEVSKSRLVVNFERDSFHSFLLHQAVSGMHKPIASFNMIPGVVDEGVNAIKLNKQMPNLMGQAIYELYTDPAKLAVFTAASKKVAEAYSRDAALAYWAEILQK